VFRSGQIEFLHFVDVVVVNCANVDFQIFGLAVRTDYQ
jgi:hypothetical protein